MASCDAVTTSTFRNKQPGEMI